jgi:signal transduction histidine kinase
MSAGPQFLSTLPNRPDVLSELLHSLAQPLTSLRCSLELSIEEVAGKQRQSVAIALQQAENVIRMIQLMREYVDTEQPTLTIRSSALAPGVRSVVEELASVAAVRGIRLRLVGTCNAKLAIAESRLRLVLQYLIAAIIESQPTGGRVMLLLGEGPAGAALRVEGDAISRAPYSYDSRQNATCTEAECGPEEARSTSETTLRRVRLSIASRGLEAAGASLVYYDGGHTGVNLAGFVLRVPRRVAVPS